MWRNTGWICLDCTLLTGPRLSTTGWRHPIVDTGLADPRGCFETCELTRPRKRMLCANRGAEGWRGGLPPLLRPIRRAQVRHERVPKVDRLDRQLPMVGHVKVIGQRLDPAGHADDQAARWNVAV